jgi:hypothetical protein
VTTFQLINQNNDNLTLRKVTNGALLKFNNCKVTITSGWGEKHLYYGNIINFFYNFCKKIQILYITKGSWQKQLDGLSSKNNETKNEDNDNNLKYENCWRR